MKVYKIAAAFLLMCLCSFEGSAQAVDALAEIQDQINALRKAHLNSDVDLANQLYHPKLIVTSQSGKKYTKKEALENIKNSFEYYENLEIEFMPLSNDVVLTNYLNERKYKDFEKGIFRLTTVWTKDEGDWRIISMQSSRLKQKLE